MLRAVRMLFIGTIYSTKRGVVNGVHYHFKNAESIRNIGLDLIVLSISTPTDKANSETILYSLYGMMRGII
jgi:hypothetical protein